MIWLASRLAAADPLVAVVVVDQVARDEGYALQLEDLVLYDALPVEVDDGERVQILDPDGKLHPLDVAPGEAWEITGPRGEAWMSRLGDEVRTDVLVVRGDDRAVRTLAEALSAQVVVEGDEFWLVGPDILFEAPWVGSEGLDHLDEVRFVRAEPEAGAVVTRAPSRVVPGRPVPVQVPPSVQVVSQTPAPVAVAAVARPAAPVADPVGVGEDVPTPTIEPELAEPVEEEDPTRSRDSADYVGMYLCGDGSGLILDPSGAFSHSRASGEWYVSAPGVVRLLVGGAAWGRAAIEIDRRYCRAVW